MREYHTALDGVLQGSPGGAGLDRKTNLSQVELPAKDSPANNFNHFLADRPQFINLLIILTDEASILMGEITSEVVFPSRSNLKIAFFAEFVTL